MCSPDSAQRARLRRRAGPAARFGVARCSWRRAIVETDGRTSSPPSALTELAYYVALRSVHAPASCRLAVSRLQLGQEPQDLQVQPHQGHQQAEGAVPLHVLRRAAVAPCSMKSKSSTRLSAAMTTTNTLKRIPTCRSSGSTARDAEEAEHDGHEIDQRDPAGRREDAQLEVLGGPDHPER